MSERRYGSECLVLELRDMTRPRKRVSIFGEKEFPPEVFISFLEVHTGLPSLVLH